MSELRKPSKISLMHMFHELKQQFPTVPDQVVSDCIIKHSTNREACVSNLRSIQKNYVQQIYPSDIVDKMANRPKFLDVSQNNLPLPKLEFTNESQSIDDNKNLLKSNKSDETQILDIDLNINGCQCLSISAPTTPSQQPCLREHRHKSYPSLEPVSLVDTQCRPFTSVSLTLRTPTKIPLPPLDLSTRGGSELKYTACSFDPINNPNNCYQSTLQVSVDSKGETTVTTSRVMVSPTNIKSINRLTDSSQVPGSIQIDNISPITKMVIDAQLERKRRLASELSAEKQKLEIMKKNVVMMEEDIARRSSYSRKVERLRNDVELLRLECKKLTVQVNTISGNLVSIDETNEQFYDQIYTGQKVSFGKVHKEYQDHMESQNWVCPMCTFQNHPILPRCEQCDMACFDLGKPRPYSGNIRVRITHRINHPRKTTSLY